jgi:outer membrane receptor for ferrienterochelin and colicin
MASNKLAKSLKRSALAAAVGICFAGGVNAQTNTSGAITGSANPGDSITVSNPTTGFSRTITVGADGNYRFSALPTGEYQVSDNGGAPRAARVSVGVSVNVDFAAAGATTLGAVTVVGTNQVNPIDVSSVESTTILTAEQINKIPVARDATSVAILAPGTVRGAGNVGALAGLPSFGGSSVSENQYYVNGFNITNTFNNLSFVQVPFEAVAEQQLKTGGYGAEFGRSTGGVINLITKRGSNEFHAGGSLIWSPKALAETNPDFYYNDGTHVSDNSKDKGWDTTAAVWASGALVKDRLFAYGLLQYGKGASDSYPGSADGVSGGNNFHRENKRPQWLLKMDWNITDSHILELTAMSDKRETEDTYYKTTFGTTAAPTATPTRAAFNGVNNTETGGNNYSLKYTGYLTDTFTLSALYGHGEFSRGNDAVAADGTVSVYNGDLFGAIAGCPIVQDGRVEAVNGDIPALTGCVNSTTLGRVDAGDERDQYRIDAEWQLGDHLLRGGVDVDNFKTVDGSAYSGGARWIYYGDAADMTVEKRDFRTGSSQQVKQQAFYIEDSWNVTDNFIAYLGLRWDSFKNINNEGVAFVDIKNQFAPRLGFSWDVFGDSTFKVFANAGRYALPVTANVATRSASADVYAQYYYAYTGIDPTTNAPTGLTAIPNPRTGSTAVRYLNGEDGTAKYAAGYASQSLQPMYQDEYILGFQKQLTDHVSLGMRGIHRQLKTSIDDNCDYATVLAVAAEQGYDTSNGPGQNFNFCFIVNPGEDVDFLGDVDGDGTSEVIHIPADRLGPGAKRSYSALEFFFQGNWDKLFLQGSYTYAKSIGNTEGTVKSDNGGQTDTGVSADFDYTTVMLGAYGYTPNDRRHALKLFGNYEISDEWSVGANLLVQSGRPESCFGVYKGLNTSFYGNIHFSCDPGVPDATGNNGDTITQRGTVGRTPWVKSLDLSVAYKPNWATGLQFKVDVFNVFNAGTPTGVNEIGEDGNGDPRPAANTYLTPLSWQSPRSVRLSVAYEF